MKSVFEYEHFQSYLGEVYQFKKSINSNFSIRAWSRHLGFSTHGQLNQILNGKRSMPLRYIVKLKESLSLKESELSYLELLIRKDRAKSQSEREYYEEKLSDLRSQSVRVDFQIVRNKEYFKDPLHAIILTVLSQKDARLNREWLKEKLLIEIETERLEKVLYNLFQLKLILLVDGKVVVSSDGTTSSADEDGKLIQAYHEQCAGLLKPAVEKQARENRELNSYTFNLKKEKLVEAKDKIKSFLSEFFSEYADDASESTYQLNMHLFSLTKDNL